MHSLVLYLGENVQHSPEHWSLKTLPVWLSPGISVGFISNILEHMYPPRTSRDATFSLPGPINIKTSTWWTKGQSTYSFLRRKKDEVPGAIVR